MSKRAVAVVALLIGLGLGGVVGFLSGAASSKFGQEVVKGMFATEKAADTANAQQLNRKYFSVQMPANWKVDTGMEDYDPDTYFNVESPGGNTVFFMVYDVATDPKENVQHQLAFYDDYVKKARKKPFSRWGQYNGHGMEYKGRLMGTLSGTVRIFSHSSSRRSFIIIEEYYDEDKSSTQPGFQQIASSFKLKP
jgi:hypothetical protein